MNTAQLNRAIRFFLRKTFDIREGELPRALLMQLNIFLIITTLLIVKPTVNALFLSKFGVEQLPYAFILVAVVAAVVTTLYSRLLSKIPLNRLMISTLYGSVFSLIAFGFFLRFNLLEGLILYLFYIWVAIFALLATSQYWVLANIVFNAREAKRLFGFIGAGAIAGGILGGYLTSVLAQLTSSEYLPFISALFLSVCIPVTQRIWNREVLQTQTFYQLEKKLKGTADHPFTQIRQSRHLAFIASIVGVSVIVAKLVDYQFGGVASALIRDPDELTAFFGFWFSTFNVISLLLQLFVTRRVVGTFGVVSSLFFLPGSILIAAILLMLMPELLLAAVFLKMADGGLKQSVNKAAMELLILPIPQRVKNQTKTFIDVFVDSLATGISGLMLIFLVKGLDLSTMSINILILFFLGIWMYLVSRVKGEYFKSFRQKIDFVKPPKKRKQDLHSRAVISGLKKVLTEGNPNQILPVLQKTSKSPDERLLASIQHLLQHPVAAIRAAAIRNLVHYRRHNLTDRIAPLANDTDPQVKLAVFNYLLVYASKTQEALILTFLNHADYQISCTALVTLARKARKDQSLGAQFQLEALIRKKAAQVKAMPDPAQQHFCTLGLIKAIGYARIPSLYPYLHSYMFGKNFEYAQQAIQAAGHTKDPQFIDDLIEFLAEEKLRNVTRQALLRYGKGIVELLVKATRQPSTSLEVVRIIPSVVKQVNRQKSVDFLFELLDYEDFMVRMEALRGLNLLRNTNPHLSFHNKSVLDRILNEARLFQETLSVLYTQVQLRRGPANPVDDRRASEILDARTGLVHLLEKRLDRNLERIFRLLGLKYTAADMVSIYKGLHSKTPDLRLNALEFLDNLLKPGLKKTLIPIIETAMLESISEKAIRNLNLRVSSEFECLNLLLNSPDLKIKQAVLFLISKLRDPRYFPILEAYRNQCAERLLPFVDLALGKSGK